MKKLEQLTNTETIQVIGAACDCFYMNIHTATHDHPITSIQCKNACCVSVNPMDILASTYAFKWGNGRREPCYEPHTITKLQTTKITLDRLFSKM